MRSSRGIAFAKIRSLNRSSSLYFWCADGIADPHDRSCFIRAKAGQFVIVGTLEDVRSTMTVLTKK